MLVNKRAGGGGYLYNRLRYLRIKDKNRNNLETISETEALASSEDTVNQSAPTTTQDETSNDIATTESYQMDDLLFLKTVIVNEQNMPKIKEILQKTVDRRWDLLNTQHVNMLENFPCLFVHPSLVSQFNFISYHFIHLNLR